MPAARIGHINSLILRKLAAIGGLGNGAQGRNRTTDTAIFSRMLYQLSYLGSGAGLTPRPPGDQGGRSRRIVSPDVV